MVPITGGALVVMVTLLLCMVLPLEAETDNVKVRLTPVGSTPLFNTKNTLVCCWVDNVFVKEEGDGVMTVSDKSRFKTLLSKNSGWEIHSGKWFQQSILE